MASLSFPDLSCAGIGCRIVYALCTQAGPGSRCAAAHHKGHGENADAAADFMHFDAVQSTPRPEATRGLVAAAAVVVGLVARGRLDDAEVAQALGGQEGGRRRKGAIRGVRRWQGRSRRCIGVPRHCCHGPAAAVDLLALGCGAHTIYGRGHVSAARPLLSRRHGGTDGVPTGGRPRRAAALGCGLHCALWGHQRREAICPHSHRAGKTRPLALQG